MWTARGTWSRGLATTSGSADRATTPLGGSEKSWLSASSPPPEQGDLRALEALLAQDVALHGDGGGKVPALARPVNGRERVARPWWSGCGCRAVRRLRAQRHEVNGQPGAMVSDAQDRLVGVIGLDIADGQIQPIHSIVNPDKLRHLDPVGDVEPGGR